MSNLNITNQLNFTSLGGGAKQTLLDWLYPIGTYFITENSSLNTKEAVKAHFGGEWVRVDNRFLYGGSTTGIESGEAFHELTTQEMPRHSHYIATVNTTGRPDGYKDNDWGYYWNTYSRTGNIYSEVVGGNESLAEGYSVAHNNMPPYRTVFMYRRIN